MIPIARASAIVRTTFSIFSLSLVMIAHEKLHRVVRLQVRGLVRDERVRRGVRLVEAVAGEELEEGEDVLRVLLGDAVRARPVDEGALLLRHLLGLLLAHRAAEEIGAAERVARERLGDLHHLLLVDDDAVRGARRWSTFGCIFSIGWRPFLRLTKSVTIPLPSGPGR